MQVSEASGKDNPVTSAAGSWTTSSAALKGPSTSQWSKNSSKYDNPVSGHFLSGMVVDNMRAAAQPTQVNSLGQASHTKEPNRGKNAMPLTSNCKSDTSDSSDSGEEVPRSALSTAALFAKTSTINMCEINCQLMRNVMEHQYRCEFCSKFFKRMDKYHDHRRKHTGEKPAFPCDQCHKGFSRADKLAEHKRIHTGDLPFRCNLCLKAFARQDRLEHHRRVHTGELPFVCDYCDKAFSRADKLRYHRNLHTMEKTFICDICSKIFARQDKLNRHHKIHLGIRPFVCEICLRAFVRSDKLKRHRMIHTGERPYRCEVCQKSFTRSDKLRDHRRLHRCKALSPDGEGSVPNTLMLAHLPVAPTAESFP